MEVCLSWLANIRVYLVSIAIHAGMPAIAIRHGFEALENPKTTVHVRQHKNYTVSYLKFDRFLSNLQQYFLHNDQILSYLDS